MQASKMNLDDIIFVPKKLRFLEKFQQNRIQKVYAVSNRSYVICRDIVITWGSKVYKKNEQINHQDLNRNQEIIPINVDSLGVGMNHTFGYSLEDSKMKIDNNKRTVYGWGSNKNYELGLEQEKQYGLVQVGIFDEALEAGFRLLQISCGNSHTLAVLDDQQTKETKLFGWGQSKSYQLALDTTSIVPYPVEIQYEFTSQIKKVYSKSDYNIAITQSGQLYSWGSNMFNRLGLIVSKISKISPTSSVQNNNKQSLEIDTDINKKQESYAVQRRKSVIESSNSNIQKIKIPRKIQLHEKISSVALGTYHVIALTIQGFCYTWGNGIYGQLGNNKYGQYPPQLIYMNHLSSQIKFIQCSAGQHHSCILDSEGNVYTCGSNSYGVLGHSKHQNLTKKKRCKIFEKILSFSQKNIKITNLTSGDRHSLAITANQQVYGWGSNKFNQIFIPNDPQQQNFQTNKFSEQIPPHKIISKSINYHQHQVPEDSKELNKSIFKTIQKQNINSKQPLSSFQILGQLQQPPKNDKVNLEKLKQWKNRYTSFLLKKRKQEDQFLEELNILLCVSSKENSQKI